MRNLLARARLRIALILCPIAAPTCYSVPMLGTPETVEL